MRASPPRVAATGPTAPNEEREKGTPMQPNAHLICDRLRSELGAAVRGPIADGREVARPLALDGTATELSEGQLYICLGRQLPRYPRIGRGCMVVVAGRGPLLSWYEERCCVAFVPDEGRFFDAFNTCQRLFDELEAWERALWTALVKQEPIQAMADASRDVLGGRVVVIDESFRFLARTDAADERASMTLDTIRRYGDARELAYLSDEPFSLRLDDGEVLSVNLVDDARFLGCAFVLYDGREVPEGAGQLLAFFAKAIKEALLRGTRPFEVEEDLRRWALRGLVDERPLDQRERDLLEARRGDAHVCACLGLSRFRGGLPASYLVARVERALPDCAAFEADDGVLVAFASAPDAESLRPDSVASLLLPVIASAEMSCGISDVFGDPFAARMHFLQARDALNIGHAFDPGSAIHRFSDIALPDLLRRAFDELPVEAFMGEGLRRLAEHDSSSRTSYLRTLGAYLDNNMSPTATARALGVHRSTFVERLERMLALLGSNLSDPDERLMAQIVLRSMRYREERLDRDEPQVYDDNRPDKT